MKLPEKITAGNNVALSIDGTNYPAPAYEVILVIVNKQHRYSVTSTANGSAHAINLASAVTANYAPGGYTYFYFFRNKTNERYDGGTGVVEIVANPAVQTGDYRTHARRVLDAINATIEGRATREQSEISINGRAVKYAPLTELIKWKSHYEYLVDQENGAASIQKIYMRFTNV